MMANAARDVVFRAALAIAERDAPGAADFCVRCHSPFAWYEGRSSRPEYDAASAVARFEPDDATVLSNDLDGVACMICHRSEDPGDAQIQNTQLRLHEGAVRFGPYAYEDGTDPRHETAVSTFLPTSRFCGQCHDIVNPLRQGHVVDGAGRAVPTGRAFAIERTYSEWAASRFARAGPEGRTCQDCHMPVVDRPVAAASDLELFRTAMNRHDLAGGSVWQPLAILASLPATLSVDLAPAYRASSMRARRMLESAARLEITSFALVEGRATASIRVTNLTGHKLPTGYPEGRRMWIEVEIHDEAGRLVATSGHYDEASATLNEDAQARIYDVSLGVRRADGSVEHSFHFVLNDTLERDTRIPPEGFQPSPDLDMTPVGRDYSNPDGSFRHWDEASYAFDDVCGRGALRLRARLRYQSNTREYMEFLRDTAPSSALPELAGQSWGQLAHRAWSTHGGDVPVDMASVEVVLGNSPRPCSDDAGGLRDGDGADASHAGDAGFGSSAGTGCGCRTTARGATNVAWLGAVAWLLTSIRRRVRGGAQRNARASRS